MHITQILRELLQRLRQCSHRTQPTVAAKAAAKSTATKEPKAAKKTEGKKAEAQSPLATPAPSAAAGETEHVTPNLGLTVTVSVLPDSRRRLRVRGTSLICSPIRRDASFFHYQQFRNTSPRRRRRYPFRCPC